MYLTLATRVMFSISAPMERMSFFGNISGHAELPSYMGRSQHSDNRNKLIASVL